MSLVGNLEDLSLGDIMQIISLSQKSGVLALKGEEGAGRIVFRAGLVHAACLEGRPDDLRGVLLASDLIDATTFDAFAAHADQVGCAISELLVQKSDLTAEQLDELLRESVESSILEMFTWRSGDFSFDVRNQLDVGDPQVVLSSGVNAQYLAMEGMRIADERSRDSADGQDGPSAETAPADSTSSCAADEIFGDDSFDFDDEGPNIAGEQPVEPKTVEGDASAADILVSTVLQNEDRDEALASAPVDVEPAIALDAPQQSSAPDANQQAATAAVANPLPLVLVDSDVAVLEWAKTALQPEFSRIHAFQQAEQGLARIRQYLIRGQFPVVLISTSIPIDPLSGIHGLSDFVSRLKAQASKLTVFGLHEDGAAAPLKTRGVFDAVISKPSGRELRARGEDLNSTLARNFAEAITDQLIAKHEATPSTSKSRPGTEANLIRHLRDATSKLKDASSRGEILPVVLEFASELFSRVAILIVRDEQVFAIAGRGIEALEVDPLESSPPVSLQTLDAGWIRQVLDSGKAVEGPPATSADRDLLTRFGGAVPASAYLGPIESSGSIFAMLYCDQGTFGAGIPDTTGLEVVLQHAGLALDRAALERALWEVDAETR